MKFIRYIAIAYLLSGAMSMRAMKDTELTEEQRKNKEIELQYEAINKSLETATYRAFNYDMKYSRFEGIFFKHSDRIKGTYLSDINQEIMNSNDPEIITLRDAELNDPKSRFNDPMNTHLLQYKLKYNEQYLKALVVKTLFLKTEFLRDDVAQAIAQKINGNGMPHYATKTIATWLADNRKAQQHYFQQDDRWFCPMYYSPYLSYPSEGVITLSDKELQALQQSPE